MHCLAAACPGSRAPQTCAVQLLLPGRDDSRLSLQGRAQGRIPHGTSARQHTKLLPPKIRSQTRSAAKTRPPAVARGADVDFEVTCSPIPAPSRSPSARSSTPLTLKSKLAASSPAKILLPPIYTKRRGSCLPSGAPC